jgi:outer membrane protein assembly factor BamD (BamD/ComL family)
VENEGYDDRDVRAQAIYWMGLSYERKPTAGYKSEGSNMQQAYQLYRRVTFDFPDSKWAKYARGRLADPVFAKIIELENLERERMIEGLKASQKRR